tara:strand:- start:4163 stop:5005 length:843 start_codon:yes stop_codon:yes gene_type:complete
MNADTDKELFIDKYMKQDKTEQYKKDAESFRKNLSTDVDIKKMSGKDLDTKLDTTIKKNPNVKDATKIAEEINGLIKSSEYKKKVTDYKDYILKDKGLNFQEKMGDYSKEIKKSPKKAYRNNFLASDERVIVAISESIPKEVIKNYFKSLGENYDDVLFVLNGFIGNNPKKIMPTLKYVNDLLSKDKKDVKDKFLFRVDVNPKIFSKYNLTEVPAIIFIKNYNPYMEIQGNGKDDKSNEDVYVSYGDSNIKYVLEKINKDAKSNGLTKLIKNIQKGFFNE